MPRRRALLAHPDRSAHKRNRHHTRHPEPRRLPPSAVLGSPTGRAREKVLHELLDLCWAPLATKVERRLALFARELAMGRATTADAMRITQETLEGVNRALYQVWARPNGAPAPTGAQERAMAQDIEAAIEKFPQQRARKRRR